MNNAACTFDSGSKALPGAAALEACQLSFCYGTNPAAVDTISVGFNIGEVTMIVGPNGSGKSTLLQLLLGHLSPTSGKVAVRGRHLRDIHPLDRAMLMSYVPQTPQVSFAYTVRELVAMGRWARQQRTAPVRENAADGSGGAAVSIGTVSASPGSDKTDNAQMIQAMWDMDVHALVDRTFDELSAGERQRVALARAIAQDAPIMLLDEPTSALDIRHQLELICYITNLARCHGKTVIWVTHDLNSARAHADKILILHQGKVAAHGVPNMVLTPEILEPIYGVRVEVRDEMLRFSPRLDRTSLSQVQAGARTKE